MTGGPRTSSGLHDLEARLRDDGLMAGRSPWARRRLRRTLLLVSAAVILLGAGSTAAFLQVRRGPPPISVTVLAGGVPRPVKVAQPATVAAALEVAALVPRPGRLLSVVTQSVLDPAFKPVQLVVNGLPAGLDSPVLGGETVGVVEPADESEATVDADEVVPAPPMPDVINGLWHPGQPGLANSRRGAVSGELVFRQELQPAAAPTPVTGKLVALTFDDGPGPTTPDFLRVLRDKNAKATFCVVTRLLKGKGLQHVKGMLAEGHHVCNHTVDHDQGLPGKSQKAIDEAIIGANRQLNERLNMKPAYYRPPGGNLGPNVVATAKAQGQQVLLWTVDTKDYTKPPPEAIVDAVMSQVRPGGVVLMHDGGGDRAATLAALPAVIDRLREAGYELVLPDAVPPVPAAPAAPRALPA